MKISVMIIAHNEEKNIRKCLKSVTSQTRTPDEIVLIAHNCNDNTEMIAKEFPTVRTVSYKGPVGVVHARIKGFEEVTSDIIICTDGDSFVMKNWVENMVAPFEKDSVVVGVGSPVIYYGLFLKVLFDLLFLFYSFSITKIFKFTIKKRVNPYFWGPSMAIRKETYDKIGGLSKFLEFKDSVGLRMWPDDTYLAILLYRIGKIHITFRTIVFAKLKERNWSEVLRVLKIHNIDGNIMFRKLIKDKL